VRILWQGMLSIPRISDLLERIRSRLFPVHFVDIEKSPRRVLMTNEEFRAAVAHLKAHAAADFSPKVVADLFHPNFAASRAFGWYQRIAIPGTSAFTTSNRASQDVSDPGWLNRLGNALSPEEGAILRPMPKWAYIERVLPDLRGKSVMDIGCNSGFFSFAFLDKGAASVTGIEPVSRYVEAARWLASVRGDRNVQFIQSDVMLDLSLKPHDVVFMSEVYTHFMDPLLGILRAINLARETLIIDGPVLTRPRSRMHLNIMVDRKTRLPSYLAWTMSDSLLLSYFALCGVAPEKVVRYVSPLKNHILYVIDTSEVEQYRHQHEFAKSDTPFLESKFIVSSS
jgi:protein-L-isoaspartate O-methyltransferase